MSADNYYLIDTHPLGGFGVEMGFDSWDVGASIHEKSKRFNLLSEAEEYVQEEYSEYGYSISDRAQALDTKMALAKSLHDAELEYKCLNFHPAGQESCDECSGILRGLEMAQQIILYGTEPASL